MTQSRGSIHIDDRVLTKAVYERQNSPIFAPFLLNVVCNLLNTHLQTEQLNTIQVISKWGGGLQQLKQCFPRWDELVAASCKATPIQHNIWRKFLLHYNHPQNNNNNKNLNPIQTLRALLSEWINAGHKHNTFGPYPSPYEQNEYQNVCPPMAHISEAIVQFEFESAFKANNADIHSFVNDNNTKQSSLHTNNKNAIIIPDDPFNYSITATHNTDNPNGGCIYYQTVYFTKSQIEGIINAFSTNPNKAPLILFGDNNIDKNRNHSENRIYSGGQAEILGAYDRQIAFGITTTIKYPRRQNASAQQNSYFQGQSPNQIPMKEFRRVMDKEFEVLFAHIRRGRDILVPAPNKEEMRRNYTKYFDGNDRLKFRHNLGTGIANLDDAHLKYIQSKLDALARCASKVETIDYAKEYKQQTQREWTLSNLPMENRNYFGARTRPHRLLFAEEKAEEDEKQQPTNVYGSIHYESPQHRRTLRPQQQQQQQHNQNMSVSSMQYPNVRQYNSPQPMMGRQDNPTTPERVNRLKRVPHYKSPSGYVENADEWKMYSSPRRKLRGSVEESTTLDDDDGIGYDNSYKREMREENMVKKGIDFLLLILFCFPRRMYIALVVQNRPQDVFKLMSLMFVVFAIVTYALSWEVTTTCLMWLCFAICCALAGADALYGSSTVPRLYGSYRLRQH